MRYLIVNFLLALTCFGQNIDYNQALKNRPFFSPKDYPYKAKGDGTTDDTTAIQAVITAVCNKGGGDIYFPAGTYILQPLTTAATATIKLCSNIKFTGPGIFKIKTNGGSWYSLFGTSATPPYSSALSHFIWDGPGIDLNGANNAIPSSGDIRTYPRIWLHTGNGGTDNHIRNYHVINPSSVWGWFIASTNSSVENGLIDNVGGVGSVNADNSYIYIEKASDGFLVTGNKLKATSRNGVMAITAIETHSSGIISNNDIQDFLNGMNIAPGTTTVTVNVHNNKVSGAFICQHYYSFTDQGASGFGHNGTIVSSNTCIINQLSYLTAGGSGAGIILDAAATLPFKNMKFEGNTIIMDLSVSNTEPIFTTDIAEGYIESNTGGCFDCSWINETIINAPSSALRISLNDGQAIKVYGLTATNFGSSLNTVSLSALSPFRSALIIAGTLSTTLIDVKGGTWSDTLVTSRAAYGAYFGTLNVKGITVVGPTITCVDAVCASMLAPITPNTITQLPYVDAIVDVPAGIVLPAYYLANNSHLVSRQDKISWRYINGIWVPDNKHSTVPTLGTGCGTGAAINPASTDYSGRITLGTGAGTTCSIVFATPFTSVVNPFAHTELQSAVAAPTMSIPTSSTTQLNINGTNLSSNTVVWILGVGQY